jgi:arginyl-tRNA--protein-N-Asp/Glu arginylyltransferase
MEYLHWKEEKISDFTEAYITSMYDRGFVFTRKGRGIMHQTRSVRIDLGKFEMSSENRRVVKKIGEDVGVVEEFPLPFKDYDWKIGKLAKDFYETKFGAGIMSAQKVKEMLTDKEKSNFNAIKLYSGKEGAVGYVICYVNGEMLHYSYPFYLLEKAPKDMGLGMMTLAIERAQKSGLKYIYLGSLQRSTDTYKLQFAGLEWYTGTEWSNDLKKVKDELLKDGASRKDGTSR